MLNKQDVIEINKLFDKGTLVNSGSLEFALSSANKTKDEITQLAYLLRSILLDHVFVEGNKRTGAALFVSYCKEHKKGYDLYKIDLLIKEIIEKKISDIGKIRRKIKNAIF
ncbi:Fic family protein [Candidatus Woesearchaeota archaeon]|nr:Fic family protein [Candidatus Woesearchaeota archaeon]